MQKSKKKGQEKKKAEAQGRNSVKCARYEGYDHQIRVVERKLCRILKSNGPEAARQWAEQHNKVAILDKIVTDRFDERSGDPNKLSVLAAKALGR